jgi:hypothetical protein
VAQQLQLVTRLREHHFSNAVEPRIALRGAWLNGIG